MRVIDDPIGVAECLDALAWIAASQQKPVRAATLLGAADAAWAAIPAMMQPALRGHHDAAVRGVREALPESASTAALARGSAMNQAEAIAYALEEPTGPVPGSGARLGEDQPRFTRREQEVAALVARGLSNSQIAAELVISARTVETHVQHIMDKLGFSTRAQIAAWSAAQQPAP
jgi:DNA-binding NarL/FixJ family response regulator